MIPILYETLTEGTVPTHNGLGALKDCISCKVREERNGEYELMMEYPQHGIHVRDLVVNRFIKAKPNLNDVDQLFRIYKIGKVMNGVFTVYAQHISYDLSGKLVLYGTAADVSGACNLLNSSAGDFYIYTDKTTAGSFKITEPSSVRSWFGGKTGSLLDVYGGEWRYNNYSAQLMNQRGIVRDTVIKYGKNLTDLQQELNTENLCTAVLPYYIDIDGNVTMGTKVSTGLTLDVPRELAIDFSDQVDPESATPIADQLASAVTRYINNNNLTNIVNSITLDFVQLSASRKEQVNLCDTVTVEFDAFGISAQFKCVETEWNVLLERYDSTTFGDARTNIASTISKVEIKSTQSVTQAQVNTTVNQTTDVLTGDSDKYVEKLAVGNSSGQNLATVESDVDGGVINTKNTAGATLATLSATGNGGMLELARPLAGGGRAVTMIASPWSDGTISLNLYDDSLPPVKNIELRGKTGEITCVSITQTSSRKVKKNIKPIEDASKILDLEAVAFDFIEEARGSDKRGFIAEDVAKILPNLVTPEREDAPASIDYIQMIPYLQEVIKNMEARIKTLEEKLNGTD